MYMLYAHCPVEGVFAATEREKESKYAEAGELRHASFSPFVVSVDGLIARLAMQCFMNILAIQDEEYCVAR